MKPILGIALVLLAVSCTKFKISLESYEKQCFY